jgi:hypothetical protein
MASKSRDMQGSFTISAVSNTGIKYSTWSFKPLTLEARRRRRRRRTGAVRGEEEQK